MMFKSLFLLVFFTSSAFAVLPCAIELDRFKVPSVHLTEFAVNEGVDPVVLEPGDVQERQDYLAAIDRLRASATERNRDFAEVVRPVYVMSGTDSAYLPKLFPKARVFIAIDNAPIIATDFMQNPLTGINLQANGPFRRTDEVHSEKNLVPRILGGLYSVFPTMQIRKLNIYRVRDAQGTEEVHGIIEFTFNGEEYRHYQIQADLSSKEMTKTWWYQGLQKYVAQAYVFKGTATKVFSDAEIGKTMRRLVNSSLKKESGFIVEGQQGRGGNKTFWDFYYEDIGRPSGESVTWDAPLGFGNRVRVIKVSK